MPNAQVRVKLGYLFASLALLLALTMPMGAAASPINGIGQSTPKIAVYPYNYNTTWQTALNQGLANWNATFSPVSLTKSTLSGSTLTAAQYNTTWYGYYQSCGPTCMYIRMNSKTIAADATNVSNFIQSVTVHEYGHALYLNHVTSTSIMNRSRNRNTMIKPQTADVNNVKAKYSTWPSS